MFNVIIPARYGSTRFPGKPLIDLAGKSMIRRVYEQAMDSSATTVHVATDDARIAAEVESFGGQVVMTRTDHLTGTDRIHEAAKLIGLSPEDIVVNVQGDEPLIPPVVIDSVADMITETISMSTLCERIQASAEILDPNIVKVVFDSNGTALYFSRAPVPFVREWQVGQIPELPEEGNWFRHLGIYAYRMSLLDRFVSWAPGKLEQLEKLEQLRVLENGERIGIAVSPAKIPPGIDVPGDVKKALAALSATPEK